MSHIRFPVVSGSFYPSDPHDLSAALDYFLANSPLPRRIPNLKALLIPHAGYIYSASVAATGYNLLKKMKPTLKNPKILLLGPSHHESFSGLAVCDNDFWETPLGNVALDPLNKIILNENLQVVTISPKAHDPEHCLEVQLPFLQKIFDNFTIIPLLTGEGEIQKYALILQKYLEKIDLVIVSSDLSHYYPYEEAKKLDQITTKAISGLDLESLIEVGEACGMSAILTLLYLAKLNHWEPELLACQNSGDTAGGKNQVVGYSSFAFYK